MMALWTKPAAPAAGQGQLLSSIMAVHEVCYANQSSKFATYLGLEVVRVRLNARCEIELTSVKTKKKQSVMCHAPCSSTAKRLQGMQMTNERRVIGFSIWIHRPDTEKRRTSQDGAQTLHTPVQCRLKVFFASAALRPTPRSAEDHPASCKAISVRSFTSLSCARKRTAPYKEVTVSGFKAPYGAVRRSWKALQVAVR
jgi:hypothetical protein